MFILLCIYFVKAQETVILKINIYILFFKATSLTLEGGRLKRTPQLIHGRDYEMVPEPVWRALYHWYGANLALPRPVSIANSTLYKEQS